MTRLSVNLNKVALIRNSRETAIPSVLDAARTCIEAGCNGITVHPRPDMRHIRPDDVLDLAEMISRDYPDIEFNIEGNPYARPDFAYPGFLELVKRVRPDQCTLVPDDPTQLTSDHGWDLTGMSNSLQPIVAELQGVGIRVSAFMDPDLPQLTLAKKFGLDRVELYTGPYAKAYGTPQKQAVFQRFAAAADAVRRLGMGLNAGHDLNLENLEYFCQIRNLAEVSIGHAIIADALWMGLEKTVRAYREILDRIASSRPG